MVAILPANHFTTPFATRVRALQARSFSRTSDTAAVSRTPQLACSAAKDAPVSGGSRRQRARNEGTVLSRRVRHAHQNHTPS
jgi:hypothetical protein